MTNKKSEFNLSDTEMYKLLSEINEVDDDIEPMSLQEVEELEAKFQTTQTDFEADKQELQVLAEMRQEFFDNISPLPSIIKQAQQKDVSLENLLTQSRLSIDILMKLEQRVFDWIPDTLVERLAQILDTRKAELYLYFQQPPNRLSVAASSHQQPTGSRVQSWQEAVATSKMSDTDKAFWLNQS